MLRFFTPFCFVALLCAPMANAQDAVPSGGSVIHSSAPHLAKGTQVQLMVTREINSRSAKAGERVKLRVNAPVLVGTAVAIPVGATAWGEVVAVSGTSAAGGRGHLSMRLLSVETTAGPLALNGTKGTEGKGNAEGVVLGVLGFGLLGLLNKGGNALFKAGDIITGYIDEGDAPSAPPLMVG